MTTRRLNVVLHWHMHQPCYRVNDRYVLPWVYLHAIKDYTDMAAHVESIAQARAVFNFVPVLLEQLVDYRDALRTFLERGDALPDPLLDALARDPLPDDPALRHALVEQCLNVNERHVLGRWAAYAKLASLARSAADDAGRYLGDAYLTDLLVWFHLAWLGEHVRRTDERVKALLARERGYTVADRRTLVTLIWELLDGVIERYRRLAAEHRIELSVTPEVHPILPLLIDFGSMREALPNAPMPRSPGYPGGLERARWHLSRSQQSFASHFGAPARGCWPAEGAISAAALAEIAQAGFQWTASGGGVLSNSLLAGQQSFDCRHRPFSFGGLSCFFRDDGLSDLIGFSYKDWGAEDAVTNLVGHLETIASHCNREDAVAVIVLDGENAWESYPENGYEFLQTLYRRLGGHPEMRLTTYSDYLAEFPHAATPLDRVVAGSWVYGTLSTWIGHADKNLAWDLLCDAKRRFDARRATLGNVAACETLLGICEGSDWFWWLGEDNSSNVVRRFESLFRAHVKSLYDAMGEPVPDALNVPLSLGTEGALAHTMRAS